MQNWRAAKWLNRQQHPEKKKKRERYQQRESKNLKKKTGRRGRSHVQLSRCPITEFLCGSYFGFHTFFSKTDVADEHSKKEKKKSTIEASQQK